jgi:hypothetical protein
MTDNQVHEIVEKMMDSDRVIAELMANTKGHHSRIKILQHEVAILQKLLATEFGSRYNWKLTRTWIHPGQLGRRSNQQRNTETFEVFGSHASVLDHPFYFRERQRPYHPAAIAVHLYDWPHVTDLAEELCFRYRIGYQLGNDLCFPSWWYPGRTTLLVYTPGLGIEGT